MKTLAFALFLIINLTLNGYGQSSTGNYLYRCNEKLTDVIMEDVFNPAQASRVHVYPNIAAYQVLSFKYKELTPLSGVLSQLKSFDKPATKIDYSLSALTAYAAVARKLVYSEYMINDFENAEQMRWLLKNNNDSVLFKASVDFGHSVSQKIIEWIKGDNYDYTRTLSRYVLSDTAGAWMPTAPEYMTALEPNWPLMRSFIFDSQGEIRPRQPNLTYSEDKNSRYYKEALEVYELSMNLDSAKKFTALYWDDNPNANIASGHLSYFIHKIYPGGHWVKITGQAVKNLNLDEMRTVQIYTLLTLGNYEGFRSAWIEKYSSNAVRPETYINKLIAPKWLPYIETPPFPEYPSAHSVTSGASATILTALIPQPYSFTDSSEMFIGMPPRYFKSFMDAANEAGMSRFYGGIHYRRACEVGILQGTDVANAILNKLIGTHKMYKE